MSKFNWVALNRNYEDIIYETYDGIAKITINRPEVRNAFRPKTVVEMIDAFSVARDDTNVGVIILTGANHGKGEDKEIEKSQEEPMEEIKAPGWDAIDNELNKIYPDIEGIHYGNISPFGEERLKGITV